MKRNEPALATANLSRQALRDFARILRHSHKHFVRRITLQSEARLRARFLEIEQGLAVGHTRPDIADREKALFLNEPPWVIVYDPKTRQILRIVHGARDLPSIGL